MRSVRALSSRLDPCILALLVAVTRFPFFAKTLFEFDSVNYAVALFRFDFSQDTPHIPGYLLHVGIAKILFAVVHDVNLAYVLESFFLSIGSVVFVWWGIRAVAGRSVAFAAAAVWALNPILWFYGCVASVYPHEAFFTAAVAAMGLRYCTQSRRAPLRAALAVFMAITISIASSARESSVLFLMPALFVALASTRAPARIWLYAALAFIAVAAIWIAVLLSLAGGWAGYAAQCRGIAAGVMYNSIFLHGTFSRHLNMFGKMTLYLVFGTAPLWTFMVFVFARRPKEMLRTVSRGVKTPAGMVLTVLAAVPLAFYTIILYSKPGYLLNIFVAATIATAALAEKFLQAGVVRGLKRWGALWCVVWAAFFFTPLPTAFVAQMHQQDAVASASFNISYRYPTLHDKIVGGAVKLFRYASLAGIDGFENEDEALLQMLQTLPSAENHQAIIATYWGQKAFFYRPHSFVYQMSLLSDLHVPSSVAYEFKKMEIRDSVVKLPAAVHDVVLLMWSKHPLFPQVARQVRLRRLPMPEYLDAWLITDQHFRLTLGGITFIL